MARLRGGGVHGGGVAKWWRERTPRRELHEPMRLKNSRCHGRYRNRGITSPAPPPRVSSRLMPSQLMISVAGVRGIVGDSLDPSIVARFSAALARSLPGEGPVVIGRDARVTGPMVRLAACAGINAAGRDVVDIGLA